MKVTESQFDFAKIIVNTVREPFLVLDKNFRVLAANRSFYKQFQLSAEEAENRPIYDLGKGNWDIPGLHHLLEKTISECESVEDYMIRISCEPTGDKILLINGQLIESEKAGDRIILLSIEDVTEHTLEEAQQLTHVGSWNWNVETNEIVCSAETYRIYGEEPFSLQVTENIYLEYVHPEDRVFVKNFITDVKTGITNRLNLEFRIVRKNGEVRHIHSIGEIREFTTDGKPLLITGTGQDITERKLLEKKLEAERDFVATVIQTSGALIAIIDLDGTIIRFNKACEELTGYAADEVIGRSVFNLFILREERDAVMSIAAQLFAGERWVEYENHWLTKNGGKRFIRWRNSILFDDSGQPLHAIATGIDITDRKRAEEALRESEASLKRAQEIAHLGSWELDLVANRLTWSDENYRIFGLQPQEFEATYEAFLEHVHPDDREAVDAAYSGSVRDSLDSYEIEHRVLHKATGEIRFVHEKCYHERDTNGKIIRSLGMIHDITDRKKFENALRTRTEELEIANRDLESFSYSVSHDLRSPLTVIQGFSKILLEEHGSKFDEHSRSILNHITSASNKMASIMTNLLNLARISRENMNCHEIDLNPVANGIVEELRQSEPHRNVQINIAGKIPVHADPKLMTIAVRNLIENAWKYTGKNPNAHIEIGSISNGNMVTVFIQDNGVGFDMNFAQRIFQPFERLHSDSQFAGTGIGLAIVQRIIQRHGGMIWAESEIDKGSTFYFTLNCTA